MGCGMGECGMGVWELTLLRASFWFEFRLSTEEIEIVDVVCEVAVVWEMGVKCVIGDV